MALCERYRAKLGQIRAWKLFCLVPKMLLHRPRVTEYEKGHWEQLIQANEFRIQSIPVPEQTPEEAVTQPRAECKGDSFHELDKS